MDLDGRTALVTGTSRGIGPAIARALRARGARVLCHARTRDGAERAAADLDGVPVWGDLEGQDQLDALAGQVLGLAPVLHVLVHNAGVLLRGAAADVARTDLERSLAVNAIAPALLTRSLLPALRAARSARVVVVSSTMGQLSGGMSGGSLPYRMSKAAVNVFVANCAAELARDGILINAMHPGWVRTDMGGSGATVTVEQAAATAMRLATLPDGGPSGRFHRGDEEIPW
jgi:NAD(P)-dependent dehydrogenase (short-subunit alcohol dehydrogenase family)